MGQVLGKAPIQSEALPFVNLPCRNIHELWEAFNDIAEGFGLTLSEFQDILRVAIKEYTRYSDKRIAVLTEALFHLYDDDRNSLVDSLEFLSATAIVSAMSVKEKLWFIFGVYDFDESGLLTIDEVTLSLRATISGLCKIAGIEKPSESRIDLIASHAIEKSKWHKDSFLKGRHNNNNTVTITKDEFVFYAMNSPEVMSWIEYFGDIDEIEVDKNFASNTKKRQLREASYQEVIDQNSPSNLFDKKEKKNDKSEPWHHTATLTEPSQKKAISSSSLPCTSLTLDWIYGRNINSTAYYTNDGAIVYPAGATVVKRSIHDGQFQQSFFMEQTDHITAMAIWHEGKEESIIATSQVGISPRIHVWSSTKMENIVSIWGFHKMGVSHLDFCPSGKLLVSVGMDHMNSIAVYDWRERLVIFTSPSTARNVKDCKFLGSDSRFGICGDGFVHFWYSNELSKLYQRQRGIFGKVISRQLINYIVQVGEYVVTGSNNGELGVWEGRTCTRIINGHHSGAITAVHVAKSLDNSPGGLCVGTSDGRIHIWNESLEHWSTFNMRSYGGLRKGVNTVCWSPLAKTMLVGLDSNDLFEISDIDGSIIGTVVQAHFVPDIFGIAVNPTKLSNVATTGADNTLRLWDTEKKSNSRMVVLDAIGSCISFNHDGSSIAVGMGGSLDDDNRKKGAFTILSEEDLTIIHEARDTTSTLTDCKYSSNGNFFAIGSQDRCIYIYTANDYTLIGKAKAHSGGITHFDFGNDPTSPEDSYLRSNSSTNELFFWNSKGEQQTAKSQKDINWETETCLFSRSMMSAHSMCVDGVLLRACCSSKSEDIMACVDNIGRIILFRNPVLSPKQTYLTYRGHSASIQNLIFTADDKFLITVGREDLCLFQWRHIIDTVDNGEKPQCDGLDLLDGKALEKSSLWEAISNDRMDYFFEMEENKDEAFAPRKPWTRTICAPTGDLKPIYSEPDNHLSLEWIHGYSAAKCRNNLRYGCLGQILYNVGKTMVIFNAKEKKQYFYRDAKDEITCIAVNSRKPLCAIGQSGQYPMIQIFDYNTQATYRTIHGHHKRAISAIEFDPSGRYLVTCGQDDEHSLIIYDFENEKILSSTPTCGNKSLDIAFHRDGKLIIQCGDNFLRFWSLDNGTILNFKNAYFGEKGKIQIFYSIGFVGNFPVIGTEDGHLYRFLGRKLDFSLKAHDSSIYTIHSTNKGIITGSKDGKVKIWSQSLECKLCISIDEISCTKYEIKSVYWSIEMEKVLIGTLGNEIWEYSSVDGSNLHPNKMPLIQSHSGNNTSGLAIHPDSTRFATTSDDKLLRIWNISENKVIKSTPIEMKSRACCYSPDGSLIAVGFGSPVRELTKTYDGKWIILNDTDFSILYETRDSKKHITEMKWSKNGKTIAVGSWDSNIYIYDIDFENKSGIKVTLSSTIEQHNSYISHLDFSADYQFLQSNCGAYELCFFEVDTGLYIPGASRLKDVKWETQTCVLGWPVQGMWPPQNDGTDITSLDCTMESRFNNPIIAAGDSYGIVKLSRYPCTSQGANTKRYKAHHGAISKVRWTPCGSHLITIGELDQSVMIWKNVEDEILVMEQSFASQPERIPDYNEVTKSITSNDYIKDSTSIENSGDLTNKLSRPWVASLVAPSEQPALKPELPTETLELGHAHGFQSESGQNSLFYNSHGNLIFTTSNICVLQNRYKNEQMFYMGHTHQISAVASSPSKRFIASGEYSARPKVQIWDAQNCVRVNVLKEFHRKRIISISFSSDSSSLLTVGAENEHLVCIWKTFNGEWADAVLHTWATSGAEVVTFASFTTAATAATAATKYFLLVTGGFDQIKFWRLNEIDLISSKGHFGSVGKVQPMLCGIGFQDRFVTGTPSGHLYVWTGKKLEKIIKAYDENVTALHTSNDFFVSGSADGCITIWSVRFEQLNTFHLSDANIESMCVGIRSLDILMNSNQTEIMKVLVGTRGSEIYEISINTGDMILLHEGHFSGECWGLSMHPKNPDIFATCGDDQTLRIWSVSLRRLLRKIKTGCPVRSIQWSNDGDDLLVGCGNGIRDGEGRKDGVFMILDVATMQIKVEGRDSKKWITDVKYSPDSKTFSLSSFDENIYIYENSKKKDYSLRTVINRHNACITRIDYSSDSSTLRSSSTDDELFFHKTSDGEYISIPSQVKDIDWATTTCIYGWSIQGIWPSVSEHDTVGIPVCVHKSTKKNILVSGDNLGSIKLYNYPVISKKASYHSIKAHAHDVAKCQFSCDGSTLVTIGKRDRAILVWKVK